MAQLDESYLDLQSYKGELHTEDEDSLNATFIEELVMEQGGFTKELEQWFKE